ncbi:hypothetical protein Tco_0030782 [Tanacetum coccineum]
MRTRSQSRNLNRQQQQAPPAFVEPFNLEEPIENPAPPVVTMDDNRTMAQLLQAPTEGYEDAIVIPEINANFELKHDTFYNALNANDQDSLNSAAGGNFLDKMPRECLRIIKSKSKVRNSQNKAVVAKVSSNSSTPGILSDVVALTTEVSELKNMMKTMLIDKQKAQAPAPVKAVDSRLSSSSSSNSRCIKGRFSSLRKTRKGDLKGITTRSGVALQRTIDFTTFLLKEWNVKTRSQKDTMPPTNNGSIEDVQPLVVPVVHHESISEPVNAQVSASMPNKKTSIPFPSRRNDERRREKANDKIEKFYEIFRDLRFRN